MYLYIHNVETLLVGLVEREFPRYYEVRPILYENLRQSAHKLSQNIHDNFVFHIYKDEDYQIISKKLADLVINGEVQSLTPKNIAKWRIKNGK